MPDTLSRNAPQDIPAEKHLLGCILLDPAQMPKVADRLTPDDFYSPKHAEIWKAMVAQFEKQEPIDLGTLGKYMRNAETSSIYLTDLMIEVRYSGHVETYASAIKDQARRRAIIAAAGRMVAAAYEEHNPLEAENRAKEILLTAIGTAEEDSALISPQRQGQILQDYFAAKKEGTPVGVSTGLPTVDLMCGGGLRRGNLVVVAARTSIGKSTLAECIAENAAKAGHTILFVSLEMSPEEIIYRYTVRSGMMSRSAIEFGIDTDGDQQALTRLIAERVQLPFHVLNAPGATTMSIRSAISRLVMQNGALDLVVVDYLQLLKDSGRSEERLRIGEITATMKMLAREFNVPVLLLSQLNRNIEMRGGEPRLSDMLESGRIEADADVVIMLWETDKPDTTGNVTRMKIAKNRQGSTGPIPIAFHKPSFKFVERKQ